MDNNVGAVVLNYVLELAINAIEIVLEILLHNRPLFKVRSCRDVGLI